MAGLRKTLCYVGIHKPNYGKFNHGLYAAADSLAFNHCGR